MLPEGETMSGTSPGMSSSDKRTFEEEFSWKQIDQLGTATLQFSNHCLEYKKLCVGLTTAVPALLIKLTNNHLDTSIFVAALLIALTFWVIDAQAYFYQESLRVRMLIIADGLRQSRGEKTLVDGVGMPVVNRPAVTRRWRSYFNSSQLPYCVLLAIDVGLLSLYSLHWIGS
jgi:hypothetical protein